MARDTSAGHVFGSLIYLVCCGAVASVAQLVELLICNQWVGGSSPSAGSINALGGVPEWPKGTDCKSVGDAFGGSNPPPTTIRVVKLM